MGPWFDASGSERESAVHEELDRLSGLDRKVIVLCHLEGLSIEEVARVLRWPVGKLERRLSRALERLRLRMVRHDDGIPVGLWDFQILPDRAAIVPESLIQSTVVAATRLIDQGRTRGTTNSTRTRLGPIMQRRDQRKVPSVHPSPGGEAAEKVGGAAEEVRTIVDGWTEE